MNGKINKILFASDLTQNAWYIFEYATDLSFYYGANIVIMHVIDDFEYITRGLLENFLGDELSKKLETNKIDQAKSTLMNKNKKAAQMESILTSGYKERLTSTPPNGHKIVIEDVIVIEGDITREISKQARDSNCDLILMGTQSHKHRYSSVSPKYNTVIKAAHVPVLVIPTP